MVSFQFEPRAKINFGLPKGEEPQQTNNSDLASSSNFSVQPPAIHSIVNSVYSMGWLVLAGGANAAASVFSAGSNLLRNMETYTPPTESSLYTFFETALYGTGRLTLYAGTVTSYGLTAYCIYNAVSHLYEASKEDFFQKKDPVKAE